MPVIMKLKVDFDTRRQISVHDQSFEGYMQEDQRARGCLCTFDTFETPESFTGIAGYPCASPAEDIGVAGGDPS